MDKGDTMQDRPAPPGRHGAAATVPPPAPQAGPRARTYRLLLSHAMELARHGRLVTVAEVAAAAGVSRATAYRYFGSRSALVTAIVEESLGPVRRFESTAADGPARLRQLFDETFPRFKEFEPQLRAALQLSLEHWALERSGLLDEEPYRRGHRVRLLGRAAAPLRATLGRTRFERLMKALSVVYGIEPYVVLKDIWAASDREVESVARWMTDALVDAALREAGERGRGGRGGARGGSTRRAYRIRTMRTRSSPG